MALGGCGGSDGEPEPEVPGPRIESAVANELADASDEVARQLESGDPCAAAVAAARLRSGVTEAINAGKVPQVYLEDLSGLANEIELGIPECVEPTAPPEEEEDDDDDDGDRKQRGKGKEKGKKKDKNDNHDDEDGAETGTLPTETEPAPTTTETTTETETTTTTTTTTEGAE